MGIDLTLGAFRTLIGQGLSNVWSWRRTDDIHFKRRQLWE